MDNLLKKFRKLDEIMESIWDDPDLSKVLAEDDERQKDLDSFQDFRRRVYLMRGSARLQLTPEEEARA